LTVHWAEEWFDTPLFAMEYASVLVDEETTAAEVACLVRELELRPDDVLLDLGCGTGRHSIPLGRHVRRVVGLDFSESLLARAGRSAEKEGLDNIDFVLRDMRTMVFEGEFDAACNCWTSWGYFDDETNLDILRRVRRALKPRGRFLLEIVSRDALLRRFLPESRDTLEDGTVIVTGRRFDLATGRMFNLKTYYMPDGSKREYRIDHHMPSSDHLLDIFRRTGFVDCRLVSVPDGGVPDLDTKRIAVVGTVP
jgi:SAM-dependent methyltransferase